MKIINAFCWILVLCASARAGYLSELQQYATAEWNAAPGYIGCRFSGVLCSYDEQCIDDGLFGNCQKANDGLIPDFYQYDLSPAQRDELESILVALIESGFGWSHAYTQCVIGNVLWAYRNGIPQYDITQCEAAVRSSLDDDTTSDDVIADTDDQIGDDINFSRRGGEEEAEERGRESQGPTVAEFEQFLSGLSDRDLTDLERYVVEDLAAQQQTRDVVSNSDDDARHDNNDAYYTTDDANPPSDYNWYDESVVDKKDDVNDISFNRNRYINIPPQAYETRVLVSYDPDGTDDVNTDAEPNSQPQNVPGSNINKQTDTKPSTNTADAAQRPPAISSSSSSSSAQQSKTFTAKSPMASADNVAQPNRHSSNQFAGHYQGIATEPMVKNNRMGQKYVLTMYVLCGLVGGVTLAAVVLYLVRRRRLLQDKLANWVSTGTSQQPSDAYKDLCRQHMQSKFSEKTEPVHICGPRAEKSSTASLDDKATAAARTGSTGSSTSSWTEEPVTSNLDISTGHIVLAYMEDHLKNKDRLLKEWETLSAYDPEPCSIVAAIEPTNMRKNRFTDILPYEHSRVKLSVDSNVSNSDYINASTIMDHDPRNPAYIATQGPLPHTVADFWQMIWEQGSIVIVNLTRLTENGVSVCHRYWPEEGSDLYHIYEVHLVSEHVWCEDYVIRSFYLKNLQTSETRTVTQFHFVAWANNDVPPTPKSLLDFRRKVNKSFRCRSNPIVVHCSDGAGRTGTYCLVDMVLNRLSKGAKEIDIAATLEHIRDQRVNMVRTKEQFEFALTAVAQEVQAILHAPT